MPAAYPPVVSSIKALGYISDVNGIGYSRDIGRCFALGGHHWIVFGDTFCKNADGDFVGLTNNTAALLHDKAPNDLHLKSIVGSELPVSKYREIRKDDVVKPFIPFQVGEVPSPDSGDRIVLWNFGGCVELEDKTGRVWFEKSLLHADNSSVYCGMGVAKVTVHDEKLVVERVRGELEFGLVFGPDEPRVGSFSTLIHGNFVYLWSNFNDNIILARTHRCVTVLAGAYMYWNGKDYVPDYNEAVPIQDINNAGIVQGGVFRSHLFGEKKSFLLIGVDKFVDSKIQLGVAENVEGPWEIHELGLATGIDKTDGFIYCIYPLLWRSNTKKGELMVTWSEQYPGGVIAARIQFDMEEHKDEL
ncbi:hypothetical protein P7C71_g6371, partial [Lecanoromycetidae sp. Uapishka_2]